MTNSNANLVLDVLKSNTNYAIRKADDVFYLMDEMAKFAGKTVNLKDLPDEEFVEVKEFMKKLLTVERYTASYIGAVMSSISDAYEETWSHYHGSVNNFHERIGAGRASAHYERFSTAERALNGTLKAEDEADNSFAFYVLPIVRFVKFLRDCSDTLFTDMNSREANDYVDIWNYAVEACLTFGQTAHRLWNELPYLSSHYGYFDKDTGVFLTTARCRISRGARKIPKLTSSMLYSKMMNYARDNGGTIEFPEFTMTDLRSLAEVRNTKTEVISRGYAEAVLNYYNGFAYAEDTEYYAIPDMNELERIYFNVLDQADRPSVHNNILRVREMFSVYESWRNCEYLQDLLRGNTSIDHCLTAFSRTPMQRLRKHSSELKYKQAGINLASKRTALVPADEA